MSHFITRTLLEASLALTPDKPAKDPFACSRRLLREAKERGDDAESRIDNRAAASRMARACRED